MYRIDEQGHLIQPKDDSYEATVGMSETFEMIVLSKRKLTNKG